MQQCAVKPTCTAQQYISNNIKSSNTPTQPAAAAVHGVVIYITYQQEHLMIHKNNTLDKPLKSTARF
jgi:hypothetical protein